MSVVLIMRAVFEIRQTVITLVSVQVVDDIARWPFAEERFSYEGVYAGIDVFSAGSAEIDPRVAGLGRCR